MKENLMPYKNSISGKLVFFLTIIVAYYWFLGQVTDVYRFEVVGAVYEILWLPVLVMLFVLPVIALVLLIKVKTEYLVAQYLFFTYRCGYCFVYDFWKIKQRTL